MGDFEETNMNNTELKQKKAMRVVVPARSVVLCKKRFDTESIQRLCSITHIAEARSSYD